MPVLVRYCNKCGIRIPPLDLEMNRAVEHHGVFYCAKCADDLVVVAEIVEEEKPSEQKNPQLAQRKQHVHSDKEKVPHRHVVKERARHEEQAKPEYYQPSSNLLPLYLLIIGVFIALVVIVLIANKHDGKEVRPDPPGPIGGTDIPPETGRKTSAGMDTELEQKLSKELEGIVRYAEDNPDELKVIIARIKEFLKKTGLPMSVASEARLRLTKYREKFNSLSKKELDKTLEKASALLKDLKFEEALKVLEDFPSAYTDEDTLRDLDREKQRIAFEKGAHEEYVKLLKFEDEALKEGSLEVAEKALKGWLEEFGSTVHSDEIGRHLVSVQEMVKKKEREKREEAQKEYAKALKSSQEKAEKGEYGEAVTILKKYAEKYKNAKALVQEVLNLVAVYENLDKQAKANKQKPPREPRFRVDFTGDKIAASMKYKFEAAAVKSSSDSENCLSLPAPEASRVWCEFELEKVPERLVLAIEHAGAKPPRGKKTVLIDVMINGNEVLKQHKVEDSFSVEPFNITKHVRKGSNTLEINPSKKSEAPYLLRKIGIAISLEVAFTPLEDDSGGTGPEKKDTVDGGKIFDGETLNGWEKLGPVKWEVQNGVITGKHTGGGAGDVGFVFPFGDSTRKWLDYKLTFEVWSNVSGGWQVGLRARKGTGGLATGNLLNASEGFEKDKWWKIELTISGENVLASVNGSKEFEQGKDKHLLPGTFAFGVKAGAVAKFRNIKFELLKSK